MIRGWARVAVGLMLGMTGRPIAGQGPAAYRSPYRVEFATPPAELVGDLAGSGRGDPRRQASIPFEDWYSPRTQQRWGGWGPGPRHYPAPSGFDGWTVERKRERVVATALRFEGYAYQHHHIPDWDPPAGWPWIESCAGGNGKGVDCSNLTGFAYNLGCGLRITTDVAKQAEERVAEGPGDRVTRLQVVELPEGYEERVRALRTGDLLFIRGRAGSIGHVVLWVGPIGKSPDGAPLVLDSHGADTRDSSGHLIPCGVHLRPYRANSWYHKSASHALRAFPD